MESLGVMLGTYSRNDANSQLSGNEENMDRRFNELILIQVERILVLYLIQTV